MHKHYDTLVVGPSSLDQNIDYQDFERREVGGAIVQSGFAAAHSGNVTAIFTKLNPKDADPDAVFAGTGADIFWKPSAETCSIRNKYFTADKERRDCRSMGKCDPFTDGELFRKAHATGAKVAVDVQCMLRHVEDDKSMQFHDWADKLTYLPEIDFLKTDATEAAILTGLDDRAEAARQLHAWGAKEIMVTHNTEVLIYDGTQIYTCPIVARNLSGRTGRGDTCFAGYITERLRADVPTALQYAAALVSLKMETPGPFQGTREDVMAYIKEMY